MQIEAIKAALEDLLAQMDEVDKGALREKLSGKDAPPVEEPAPEVELEVEKKDDEEEE